MQELLTREERDRLAERLLPGEKILWQGKSRCGWWRRAAKEWKGMLFSVFFAAAWGWGCCIAASAPVWTGEVMFALAVMGICCFFGIALLGMLLINAVLETRRANAVLHALTNMRLLSLGPSADGNGVPLPHRLLLAPEIALGEVALRVGLDKGFVFRNRFFGDEFVHVDPRYTFI